MGGSMAACLQFLGWSLNSLEKSRQPQTMQQGETAEKHLDLVDKLNQSRVMRWLGRNMKEKESAAPSDVPTSPPEGQGSDAADGADKALSASGGNGISQIMIGKINHILGRLGFHVSEDETLSFPLVCLLISLMFITFGLKAFADFVNKYSLRWVGSRVVTDIRLALFKVLQKQSMSFFSKNDVGELISRCTYDTGSVEQTISSSIAEMTTAPVLILASVQYIIRTAIEVHLIKPTLVLLVAMPVCIVPVYLISTLTRRYQRRVLHRISLLVSRMQENFSGIAVIKAFHMEEIEAGRFQQENDQYFRSAIRAVLADIFMQPVMQLTAIALAAGFVVACYHFHVSLGTLAAIGVAAQQAYKPIKELAKLNSNLQKSAAAAERIFELLDTDTSLPVPENPIALQEFHAGIRFEHVDFQYDMDGPKVLDDICLDIPRGSLVAIVGHTGSGKSTLASLLGRFYDPTGGRILIDGHDIRDVEPGSFRSLVGIVSQETFLFNESLADNIRFGNPQATPQQVEEAARLANAHEFIMEDADGYDRLAGERGGLLSGGQKQRIAIARALLKNPPILILDEATSALDTRTEKLVQEAIDKLMSDRTVLAIAHRLSTILHADQIVVMDHGRIVEKGTHRELYEQNGVYRMLYDLQSSQQPITETPEEV